MHLFLRIPLATIPVPLEPVQCDHRLSLVKTEPRNPFEHSGCNESGRSQPAAIASSGFRSITQYTNRPPRTSRTGAQKGNQRGMSARPLRLAGARTHQPKHAGKQKGAKIHRPLHFRRLSKPRRPIPDNLTPCHVSFGRKQASGLVVPRRLAATVTPCLVLPRARRGSKDVVPWRPHPGKTPG